MFSIFLFHSCTLVDTITNAYSCQPERHIRSSTFNNNLIYTIYLYATNLRGRKGMYVYHLCLDTIEFNANKNSRQVQL